MAQEFLVPGGIVSLSREAVRRLCQTQNGDAALYYLALLLGEGEPPPTPPWPRARIEAAQGALMSLALLDPAQGFTLPAEEKLESDRPPDYGRDDVALALRTQEDFPTLVGEIERRLGRLLFPSDLQTLLLLRDYLALPPEIILLLVGFCIGQMQKKHGEGRKPTMNQIKKEAFCWQRAGIDTLEAAEAHLRDLETRASAAARILPLLDIVGRPPVEAERRYLEAWSEMGFDDEALRLAYEKTVLKKQSMNWPYMNSILRNWNQNGLHTKAEIAEKEQGNWQRPSIIATAPGALSVPTPEAQERTRKDLNRLDRLLAELKGEH